MSNLQNTFFSPLSKDACFYFYFLTVFFFFVMVIAAISGAAYIITKPSKVSYNFITHFILIVINFFLLYFVNRLYYSMCVNSLK
jgi:hypothetical protein